jgi:hypothetical protein
LAVSNSTERLRRRYKPDDVRVLFVGESPPAGGAFFYRANSKLYDATREAFERAIPRLAREEDFVRAFARLGCYVDDLVLYPVNHLDLKAPERLQARAAGVKPLARRIKPLRPRVAVVVMKAIVDDVRDALELAGHGAARREDLPFPARHRDRYVAELAEHVASWRRRRILASL